MAFIELKVFKGLQFWQFRKLFEEIRMAKQDVLNKIEEIRGVLEGAKARILEDVAELKRLILEGASTTDIEAALETLKTDVAAIDPVPEFPPPPPPPVEG